MNLCSNDGQVIAFILEKTFGLIQIVFAALKLAPQRNPRHRDDPVG